MKAYVIGAGLAGCEAAYQLAKRNINVEIFEYRNQEKNMTTFAHRTDDFAELVCSNSFRNDDIKSAIGLLHEEMRILDSLILRAADNNKIAAGSALAVDREGFSAFIKNELLNSKNVKFTRQEVNSIDFSPNDLCIFATGPLTTDKLSENIRKYSGEENLAFFDAIAPIIYHESIDFNKAWMQSRYDKGSGKDYINCPLNKDQYFELVNDLLNGDKTEFKEWEKNTPYFDGCLPVEIMAQRGIETLRFGPLKPVGLTNIHDPKVKPYGIVQLRQDNKSGTLYNMVGFQTKLKYSEQARIFKKIPGLENAEFARFGGIHRNCFINSPKLLDNHLRFKKLKNVRFAGQITGVEGYVESAAIGMLAGIFTAFELKNKHVNLNFDNKTAIGSLLYHITQNHVSNSNNIDKIETDEDKKLFQPMNVNYGLFANLDGKIKKSDRKSEYAKRAIANINQIKQHIL